MPLHSILLCIPLLLPLPMSRTGINLVWVLSIIQISLLAIVARCLCPNQGLSPTPTPFILFLFCSSVLCWVFFCCCLQLFSCVVRLSRQAGKSWRLSVLIAAVHKVPIILSKFLCPFWVVLFFRCPHIIRSAQGCGNYCIKFDCSFPPPPSPQFFFFLTASFCQPVISTSVGKEITWDFSSRDTRGFCFRAHSLNNNHGERSF